MSDYYSENLAAERLAKCYEIAPARVRRYLQAELGYVIERVRPSDVVIELGCGYGRVVEPLARVARMVVGIDTSHESLRLACVRRASSEPVAGTRVQGVARAEARGSGNNSERLHGDRRFARMDAVRLAFRDAVFDVVVCIQNGLSAFGVDQRRLVEECVRVARPGGRVLLSSYAEPFWDDRLEWFRLQAEQGLLGEIDEDATGDGVIVCKDGFRATTISPEAFADLTRDLGTRRHIEEVDGSSLFCEVVV